MSIRTILAASVGVALLTTGCADLKPLQADIANLKESVSRVEANQVSLKTTADSAAAEARTANAAAAAAKSAADQAASTAQASQTCCNENSEKMERMFRRSVSK